MKKEKIQLKTITKLLERKVIVEDIRQPSLLSLGSDGFLALRSIVEAHEFIPLKPYAPTGFTVEVEVIAITPSEFNVEVYEVIPDTPTMFEIEVYEVVPDTPQNFSVEVY